MSSFRLSALASSDLADIYLYGARRWGRAQADAYDRDLRSSVRTAAHFPQIGRRYETVSGIELRCYLSGRHVIFYRIEDDGIFIIRVLHGRMDFDRHLE